MGHLYVLGRDRDQREAPNENIALRWWKRGKEEITCRTRCRHSKGEAPASFGREPHRVLAGVAPRAASL
jgi:hypothetical protein